MSLPEAYDIANEWLRRSQGSLRMAESVGLDGTFLEDYCYLCQQAAEKALKAVYVLNGLPFRFMHSIDELMTNLTKNGVATPSAPESIDELTRHANETRIPGLYEPLTQGDYDEALAAARALVAWAKETIESKHGG